MRPIKELADQAGFMESWFSESGDDCEGQIKKLGKLIVAECFAAAMIGPDGHKDPIDLMIRLNLIIGD